MSIGSIAGMPTSSPEVSVGPQVYFAYSLKIENHDTGVIFRLTTIASSFRFEAQ